MTGQQLYDISMDILSLRLESGEIPSGCADMTARAVGLINLLIAENAFLDARLKGEGVSAQSISSLSDEIPLSQPIAAQALPYGLAALLILNENASVASMLHGIYTSALEYIGRSFGARLHGIEEVY